MKRLLTFLYLILGLVLLNKQVAAQTAPANGTAFMNLPDTICKGSFASMNAFFWNNTSNYADSATWTITGGTYDVLFTTDTRAGHELVGQRRDTYNSGGININKNSLTIKFNDAAKYTVKVVLFRGNNTYPVTKSIYVKDCTIQPCLGNTTSKSDFLEDFGKFKKNATDSRSNAAVTGYNYVPMPLNGANFIDDSYNIFWHTQIRSEWVKATDHTGSTIDSVGGMLIANSSINKKSFYTKNNVQVCPGSSYNFSAWFLNVNSYNVFNYNCAAGNSDGYHYAGVTFLIINKKGSTNAALWDTLARFKTYDVSMNLSYSTWQQYGGSFKTPGGVTAVTLEIVNDRLGDCGNDIAIDDIGFNYCSPDIYSFIDGQIDTELRADSLCEGAPITIKALYSPDGHLPNGTYDPNQDYFKNPIYQWFYSNTGDENNPADWFPVVNGNGISGAATNTLTFADGALKGDPNQIVHKYYRVNILESGNVSNCASPSKYTKITILPKPKVTISSGRICIGQSVDLTADGGYSTYEWKVDPVYFGPKMTVFPDSTRDYWAIGIADYGWNSVKNEPRQCKDSGFARVVVDKKPVTAITGGPVNICLGAQINLNLGITGAPADSLNWMWKYGIDSIKGKVPAISHVPSDTGTKAYNVVVTNKTCTVVDTFRVNVRSVPVADVDTIYRQCNISTFNIKRSTPPSDQKGTWSFDGPNKGAVITNTTTAATSVTGVMAGDTVRLFWIITNKALAACTDTNRVTLINTRPLTPSVAGLNQVQCELRDFQLNASKPGVGETGKWTLAPGTTSSDITINYDTAYNAIASVVSNARPKTFVLTWTISNGVCPGPNSTTVNLTIKDKPTLNIAAAAVCNTVDSFTVSYSNVVPGTLKQYVLSVAATRKMPGFVTVSKAWPSNNTSGIFNVKLPANIPAGSYDFVITAQEDTLHGCSVTVPFSVSVEKPSTAPTSIDASSDSLCVTGNVTLKVIGGSLGTDSTGTTHKWKWYTGACPGLPGSVAVTPASSINNGAEVVFNNVTATTTYYVRAESTGPCGNTACASVTVKVFAKPNVANANTDQTECDRATDFQLAGNTPAPAGATGLWTSPNPRVTITNPTQWNATVKVPVGDTASLVWTISNGPCLTTNDTVFITNYKKPVMRNAGTDQTACDKTTFTLNATEPTELGAKGTWTFLPVTATVTFVDKNKANTNVTVPANTAVKLIWSISNGTCSADKSDTVVITSLLKPVMRNAGTDQTACDKTIFTLNATEPTELNAQGTWTFLPTTAAVTFVDKNKANTDVTVPANTAVKLIWSISNGTCSADKSDTVVITSLLKPVMRNAGTDQTACDKTTFTLNATEPTELNAQGTWTFLPVTAAVTFVDKNKANTSVTVPANAAVKLIWSISNGTCSADKSDTVTITSLLKPVMRNAGTDQTACDKTTFTLNATEPTELNAQGTWTFLPATAAVTFVDKNKANTDVTVPANTAVKLIWSISNGTCSADKSDTVVITSLLKPLMRNAGTDQTACDKTTFTLNATEPTELNAQGTWTFLPATAAVTFVDKNKANTSVTVPADASVKLIWSISNGTCSADKSDTVTITSLLKPVMRNAGTDQTACDKTTFTLNATEPTELNAQGTWTFLPATAAVTFVDKNKANTSVTVPANTAVKLIWSISNGTCSADKSDTVTITSLLKPVMRNAGTDQTACDKTTFTLNATEPTELNAQGSWTFLPATAAVTFVDKNKANTSVTVPANAAVKLIWSISNGTCSADKSDTVTITSLLKPVMRNAGTDQTTCDKTTFTLNATEPTELNAQGTWTFLPATAAVTFVDKNKANTSVTVPANTAVKLIWSISNGTCSADKSDTVTITSLLKPVMRNAGTDQTACDKTTFTLNATEPTELNAQGTWTFLPATAAVTFVDKNKANTDVTVPANTAVKLIWSISNGTCSADKSDTVVITSLLKPVMRNAGTDQTACDKTTFTLNATEPTELNAQGTWTFLPVTAAVTFVDKNKANTSVTVPANTAVKLIWSISNGTCSADKSDTVVITSLLKPVMRNAGTDQTACDKTTFTLNATEPTELNAQGTWTFLPTTAAITFVDKNKANTSVTVPANTAVKLIWSISNGTCSADKSDTVVITSLLKPVMRNAGTDQTACDKTTFTLNATEPTELNAQGTWTFLPTTAAVTFVDKNKANTSVTVPANTAVKLIWSISNGTCSADKSDTVTITSLLKPVMRNAGTDQTACDKTTFTLNATEPTELNAKGTWTFLPATAAVTFVDKNKANTSVTVPANTAVKLIWSISNGTCSADKSDTVTITSLLKPVMRNAGTDQTACDKTTFTLNATEPTELNAQGSWTFLPATAAVTFVDKNKANTSVTVPANAAVKLIWSISNGTCSADKSDTVVITSLLKPVMRNAGTDQTACDKTTFTLNATEPTELNAQGTWTFLPVTAAVTFVDKNKANTSVTVPANTAVKLIWSISNGTCSADKSDTVTITSLLKPVMRNAGTDQTACDKTTFTLNATEPTELNAQGSWTFLPATAAVTFVDKNKANTSVTVPANAAVKLIWSISNGTCSADKSDTVTITSLLKPVMRNAGTDQTTCDKTTFTLNATEPTELNAQGTWTFLPATAAVTFVDKNKANTSVTVPANTAVKLIWSISNGSCSADKSDTVVITSLLKPVMRNAGTDQTACDKTTFTLNATEPTELNAQGSWTFLPATAAVTFVDKNKANTSVTVPANAAVKLIWSISNGTCSADKSDTVVITSLLKPVMRNAGTDQTACDKTTFTLNATEPTELNAQGTWTFLPATAAVTFVDKNKANTNVTVPANAAVKLIWSISNGTCSADKSDTVVITSLLKPVMRNAGTDQTACDKTTFTLNATEPTELNAQGTWTFLPATAAVTFVDKNKANTSVTVPANAAVKLIWSISNGTCSADKSDTVVITSLLKPVMRNAGTDQTACDKTIFTLNATEPTELNAQGTWTFLPATAAVTFVDKNKANTSVTVPANTAVKLIWSISNGTCSADKSDTVVITSLLKPVMRNAGTDQTACDKTAFTLNATEPTELNAKGTWTFLPATAAVTFVDKNKANTSVTVPANAAVKLIWSISNGTCSADKSDTVVITSLLKPVMRNAGTDQTACDKTTFTLNATEPTELNAQGSWTFLPTTAAVTFVDKNKANTSVTVPANAAVKLIWSISNGTCSADKSDTVVITSLLKPVMRNAGTDQTACDKTTFTLNATEPTELNAKGTWTFLPATAAVTFVDKNKANTSVTVPADASVKLIWSISNGTCSADKSDTVVITSLLKPVMRNAGTDQTACDKTTFTLNATEPTELNAQGTWTFLPATAAVTFVDKNKANTSVTVPANAAVKLIWSISNGTCSADKSDTVTITSLLKPVMRNAGTDQTACDKTTFTLNATEPTELNAKGTWTFLPATAAVTFVDKNKANTSVTVPANAAVKLIWSISNGTCNADKSDTVVITSLLKPIMRNAGTDQMECEKTTFTLNATAPTELDAKGTWTFLPATAAVSFVNKNDPKTTVTVPANTAVQLIWSISNGTCSADKSDTVTITSLLKPIMRDAGTNKIACEQTTFTMNATAPTELGAIGTWSFSPATATVKIANINNPKTSVTVPADSTILFTWKITNPKCAADLADTVRITSYKTPAAAKAGPDQEKCDDINFILDGGKPAGLHVTGTWTNPAGTTGVTIASPNQYNTAVTVAAGVSVKLVWRITNGTCAATYDTVMLTNYANANKANAGPDQAICGNTGDFIMAANVPGVPTAKGTWTDISPIPGRAKIKSPNSPTTAVTVPVGDTVILQWAIANGVCDTSFSRVTIINYKAAITANAGLDQEKCNTTADFIMKASQPGSPSAKGTWTDVSRVPGNAVIKSVNDPNSAVTVPVGDTVILKWTVTNGSCMSTSSTVTLINYKTAAAANAGADIEMCNNTGDFTLAADPVSVPSAKGFWSVIKGNAAIRSINSPTSNVNINTGDTVTLRWTVTNGVCSATWDDVTLINYRLPVPASAGIDQEHCDDATFKMSASDPGVAGAKGTWIVTSNNAALINISDINRKDATITVPAGETAQLTWVVSNGVCDASSSSVTLINRKPILGNTIQDDQTVCVTEAPMAIRSNALTGGNGTYTYQWQQSTAGANGPFTNITGATSDTYQPGLLAANTWYRRVVASGACINNISNVVKITAITISPIVTFTPPAITTECERGKDYTTLFGDPAFSHAPYNNEPLTITYNDVTVVTSPCLSTITRTWTATDRCGLSVSASQTITVKDTKAPVFTTPAPADTTVNCDKVPAAINLKANDDCAGEIIIPVVEVRQDLPGNCANNYLLIRTWTAKDECNTGVTLKQVITVKDMTAPVFNMATPADTTVDCDKIPAGFNLTATDNCTPGVITVVPKDSAAHNPNSCNNNYVIYRKWTAFDECGNARAVQQIIKVQDTSRPVFSMPAPKDTVVDCDKVPTWPAITATDNCSGSIQVFTSSKTVKLPGNCAANFRETRTWTATDECGNKTVMQQIITVQDTTKPVFTVKPPADTTVSCDNIPAPATDVQVSDNCSSIGNGLTVSRRITTERIPGECAGNYRIIRTWIAKDACGNTTTITQVVNVKDTTRPVIMPAPADVEIYCQDKIPAAPVLTATDNCDNSFPKRAIYTEDPYVEDICNGYTIIRRWTIMDACGNKASDVIQRVIIKPCDKPQLEATLPSNCSDNGRIALRKVGNVYLPSYTLVAVTPANAVTGLPRTQSNNVFNLNGATSASFIITDGRTGCSSDTVTYNLSYIQKPMVNLGNDTTICGGNNLVLDAGPANFAYQIKWSTGATTQRININQAGTYWVNVSNGECATTDTIHVGLVPTPLVDIPDTTICRGQTVKLDAYVNGGSYLWSNGSTEPSILVGTQEQFWVKVMKSGCITIDTVKVSVNPPPDISLSRDTSICPDQSIMLTVNSNGGRIKWQTGETSNSIVVNKPGGYWVAVSRDNCVVRDTVNVRMKPALTMELGPDRNICPGGTITLDGTNPDAISYLWNDGDPNPVKQISQAGSYKLAVMDKYCQRVFLDSVKVNITGLPVINLGRDTTLCKGETLILRAEGGGITGVRWDNGSGGPSLTVTNGGTYTVTVFNDCGSATDDITVGFIECEPKPTLPNAFSPNGDGRNDVFRPVVRGQMFDYELRIFNRWGELIFMSSDNHKGWDGRYKGVPVDVGTYVWWLSYKKVAGGSSNVLKGEVTVIR